MDVTPRTGPAAAAEPGRLPRPLVVAVLVVILVASAAVLLIGLDRDLPSPEPDEPFFVLPAVEMAAHGSLNPHWFGHPGSTVILPLAAAFRAREVIFHGAPLLGDAPGVTQRFEHDPTSFFVLGRLWVMLLTLATFPVLFLVGRRAFSDLVALLATAIFALLPIIVGYGRIVRTDLPATFFALVVVLTCLRARDQPSVRRFAAAGAALGLAIATRWFMIALAPMVAVTWWLSRRRAVASRRALALAGVATIITFAATNPMLLVDWRDLHRSLTAETVGHADNRHFGPIANLGYYLVSGIPQTIFWPALVFAALGIAIAIVRRDEQRLLLLIFPALFVLAISAPDMHWMRWIIPILPVMLLFAVSGVIDGTRSFVQWRARVGAAGAPVTATLAMVAGIVLIIAPSVFGLDRVVRGTLATTTRQQMRAFVLRHVPRGESIAVEVKAPELRSAGYHVRRTYDLARSGSVLAYVRHRYRYMIVNFHVAWAYDQARLQFPEHERFYDMLRGHATLLADIRGHGDVQGPRLRLYRFDVADLTGRHGLDVRGLSSPASDRRFARSREEYPVGDTLLG
jgi:4-amino-4-deoxy-L-arabinose transferase-like glycosyltransferase